MNELAIEIADHAVRSDVELYAHGFEDKNGSPVYDTSRHHEQGGSQADLAVVERALKYIDARGDVFPWELVRQPGAEHLVMFKQKVTA